MRNPTTYFRPNASWSKVSSGSFVIRYYPEGFLYDVAGCALFSKKAGAVEYLTALLNSKLVKPLLSDFAPTLNFETGQVRSVPILPNWDDMADHSRQLSQRAISISKADWNLSETSWGFTKHP